MTWLEYLRRNNKLSQRRLGALSGVDASYICNAEKRGFRLYCVQAQRIADVLEWTGDPMALFDEAKVMADD